MSNQCSPLALSDREGSPKRLRNRRFSQPEEQLGVTLGLSQSLLDMVDEREPRTPTAQELNSRAKRKLHLSALVTSKDRGDSCDSCPHSAPVVPNQSIPDQKLSFHRRNFSLLSFTGYSRDSDSPNSSTTASIPTGRSPSSAKTRVVGRLSSLLKRDKSLSQPDFCSPQSHKLDLVLQIRECRNSLVDQLLAEHARDATLNIRFISAFHEWNKVVDVKERKLMAKKLATAFLEPSSMFYLSNVPKDLQYSIQQGSSEALAQLKEHLLDELAENPHVWQYLTRCDEEGNTFTDSSLEYFQ